MKRILLVFFLVLLAGGLTAQRGKSIFEKKSKNRFEKFLTTKKLGTIYKGVKESEKDDYFQQYFLVTKVEELLAYPHLKDFKPEVLYAFVKEIYPAIPTKTLSKENQKLRNDAYIAINHFFLNKDWNNPNLNYNVESYADPGNQYYFLKINPESVKENIPKEIYSFRTTDSRTPNPYTYYFWMNGKKLQRVDIVPGQDQKVFWSRLYHFLPNYSISTLPAQFSKPFKDQTLYVITPFPTGMNTIEYRTKDFKDFIISRYKNTQGTWVDIEQ